MKSHSAKSDYNWKAYGWTKASGGLKDPLQDALTEVRVVYVGGPIMSEAFIHVALALNHTKAACAATNLVDEVALVRRLRCARERKRFETGLCHISSTHPGSSRSISPTTVPPSAEY